MHHQVVLFQLKECSTPPQVKNVSDQSAPLSALRGPALTFQDNPFTAGDDAAMHYEPDALIIIQDGMIKAFGDYLSLKDSLNDAPVTHYPDALILPGFIDAHVHYPQMQVIGSYGTRLIDWLNTYTFVAEQQFSDEQYAEKIARVFLNETLKAGTTTAAVYCTIHPESVNGFFRAAQETGQRMIAGKVLMDRNAPAALTDTAQSGYDDSKALIETWHNNGRLMYAITPRFAPTSTPAQLNAAATLWAEHPGTYMQTHTSENVEELAWVKELYPEHDSYVDVYAHYGLTGPRAIFGHAIHLSESEWRHLSDTDSSIIHCPTSNTFLGSGFFDAVRASGPTSPDKPVRTGLATDVGGGTSLSMLKTMGEAYKVGQFAGNSISAAKAFWMATAGSAHALHLDDKVGRIAVGMEADLQVLNLRSTPLIDFRMQYCNSLQEALFIQMTLGDERATQAVYIAGELKYSQPTPAP